MKNRAETYRFTVEMKAGVPVTNAELLDELRYNISLTNRAVTRSKLYIKLQGRLGKNNPNAWKYRTRRNGGIYGCAQCVRLADAAFADVYVYERYFHS